MTSTISVRLKKDLLQDLDKIEDELQTDRSEVVRRLLVKSIADWKVASALEKLRQRKISLEKASEDCSMQIWEMIALARAQNIDWVGYSDEDLEKDLGLLK